jgi:hypothetical protein
MIKEPTQIIYKVPAISAEHHRAAVAVAVERATSKLEAENKRLREANDAFRARFNEWIMQQDEGVKLSTALAFGAEYENLLDA